MKKYYNISLFIFIALFLELICMCSGENPVKKSVSSEERDLDDDNGENNDASMEIPSDIDSVNENRTCSARRSNSHMHSIRNATSNQFPFMASLMSINDEHICSGSIISNGLILTTGTCVKQQISHALLNTVRAKTSSHDAVKVIVIKMETLPTFTGENEEATPNNVGLVYTHKFNSSVAAKIKICNITSTEKVVDLEVLGFGLNEDVGRVKNLQYVGLENRYPETNIITAFIDCISAKEPTCFKDKGGPAVFGNELVGLVAKGERDCIAEISEEYAINKLMAHIIPAFVFKSWVNGQIKKLQAEPNEPIPTYPSQLVKKVQVDRRLSGSPIGHKMSAVTILTSMFLLYFC